MKKLIFKEQYGEHIEYASDIDRIVQIFADRGYEISHTDAVKAWEQFSYDMSAGWMSLGCDEEVFDDAFYYFEEVE